MDSPLESAASSYFVCTLGQAASTSQTSGYGTITDFLDHQAQAVPSHKAVGFAHPSAEKDASEWSYTLFDFRAVAEISSTFADQLHSRLRGQALAGETVALLCPSTVDFLFNWLGLIRLGHPVLLLAPQCPADDVAHLCHECNVSVLLYDDVHEELARKSRARFLVAHQEELVVEPLTKYDDVKSFLIPRTSSATYSPHRRASSAGISNDSSAVAYLHHTSGTSSGVPKPIPQPHSAAVGVLPHLDGSKQATFTTTPLYHGGIADLFRAWTSDAMIWLFHGKGIPITAENILRSLDISRKCADKAEAPPVKYFSSVPYVLQMVSSDERGLKYLQSMDIVGVGGAALPPETGDVLVSKGVPLVSRFGSAECGFLMSSARDYAKDPDWQYLRPGAGMEYLTFESREEGLAELVVGPGWPHMAKRNRDNGSFATADLFQAHPSIAGAWKYHSRSDSQLTLINGKKFDPAPVEATIASSDVLEDALVFGTGRPFPGALVFRAESAKDDADSAILQALQANLSQLNEKMQNHSRIAPEMIVVMPYQVAPLEKSSKGTILRGRAEKRYAAEIEKAYTSNLLPRGVDTPDESICGEILRVVNIIMGNKPGLTVETDLFSFGVDSVASIRIRAAVLELLPKRAREVPLTIVENCGTIKGLADFLVQKRKNAGTNTTSEPKANDRQLMLDLVEQYGQFKTTRHISCLEEQRCRAKRARGNEVVVLTGATGGLGSHILACFRRDPKVRKIYCLVRDVNEKVARVRLNQVLKERGLDTLPESDEKVVIVRSQLSDLDLGINEETYEEIANTASLFVHLAWAVNFRLSLRSFARDHISGLRNLINLALSGASGCTPRFIFCSSVASVAMTKAGTSIAEEVENDPDAASGLGYSQSKWVAEQMCQRAHQTTRLKSRICVLRVGQLSGDSITGAWNRTEAWPLLLSSVKMTGCLPALQNEPLDWLPLDKAAEAFVQTAEAMTMCMHRDPNSKEHLSVLHIVNNDRSTTWADALGWLQTWTQFAKVAPDEFIEKLEKIQSEGSSHPALKLLGLWKAAYGSKQDASAALSKSDDENAAVPRYHLEKTIRAAPCIGTVSVVEKEYFEKLWRWIDLEM